jgi:hypothetical protein
MYTARNEIIFLWGLDTVQSDGLHLYEVTWRYLLYSYSSPPPRSELEFLSVLRMWNLDIKRLNVT